MSAQLHRRHPRPRVVDCTLGRTSLAALAATVMELLRDPRQSVVVEVTGFDYFDEHDVAALLDLMSWSPRVSIVGLDGYADQLAPRVPVVDVRTKAERAVTHLSGVTVVTAIVDGQLLSEAELDAALSLALEGNRAIVTVDLRHVDGLSPAQLLSLAEVSADLHRDVRTLILVNATTMVADQLRRGGLSGSLRVTTAELT